MSFDHEWRERLYVADMKRYFKARKARKAFKLNRNVPPFVVRRLRRAEKAKLIASGELGQCFVYFEDIPLRIFSMRMERPRARARHP